jgi:energy-coupling factor transporter ATP-binding protein EcfA2
MLSVQQLHVKGRRDDLLPPTSLQARRGELVLVSGNRQDQRTALALTLSGRMKPSSGQLLWDGRPKTKHLRLAASLVDSPGVNEPEQHLSVRDLVTEDLALIPRRYRGALLSKPWLKVNRFEDIAGLWTEQLAPARRIELLTALSLANPDTDLLVIDSPDRHSADSSDWLTRLEELAYDGGRPLAVVATVAALPSNWTGPAAVIGNAALRHPVPGSFCPDNPAKTSPKSADLDKNSEVGTAAAPAEAASADAPTPETEDAK